MFERFKRVALSIALLLYLTADPQAHTPEVFPADHIRQGQTTTDMSDHQPPNGYGNLSISRRLDFRDVIVSQPLEVKTTPLSIKPTRSASPSSRPVRPERKSRGRAQSFGNSRFLLAGMRERWKVLNSEYHRLTGRNLTLTSGFRTSGQQAVAIQRNLRAYGTSYVVTLYHRSSAIKEVVAAYRRNRLRPKKAILAITTIIQAQVRRGVYISDHMRGKAFDIRSHGRNGARLSALQTIAKLIGGSVLVERSHYHVEF